MLLPIVAPLDHLLSPRRITHKRQPRSSKIAPGADDSQAVLSVVLRNGLVEIGVI
jgi:hypothetical protein